MYLQPHEYSGLYRTCCQNYLDSSTPTMLVFILVKGIYSCSNTSQCIAVFQRPLVFRKHHSQNNVLKCLTHDTSAETLGFKRMGQINVSKPLVEVISIQFEVIIRFVQHSHHSTYNNMMDSLNLLLYAHQKLFEYPLSQ